ncbi:MAG: hypothetical protein WKF84_15370 [Pyrinomonadaceae bacterium]
MEHWKARGLDFRTILYKPDVAAERRTLLPQSRRIMVSKMRLTTPRCLRCAEPALEHGESVEATLPIRNVNRVGRNHSRQRSHAPLRSRGFARRHDQAAFHRFSAGKASAPLCREA